MSKFSKLPKIENVPQHIAFIVDGNRRWAKDKGLPIIEGHRRGSENLEKIFDFAKKIGVKYVTAWVFSTENWNRSETEVNYLFELFREKFKAYKKKFMDEEIRFIHIGRKDRIPEDVKESLIELEEETKDFTEHAVAFAIDYGGRDELVRATNAIIEKGKEVSEESINKHLDTVEMPEPDLIIRTSGELRLSGFMLWQSAYAEFAFPKVTFPAFTEEEFTKVLQDYSSRERRFGGESKEK
jgi:undecaprenyl diphosphate synthase